MTLIKLERIQRVYWMNEYYDLIELNGEQDYEIKLTKSISIECRRI